MKLTPALNTALQANSLEEFVTSLDRFLQDEMLRHSVCVSFNNLHDFSPWLVRDTQPMPGTALDFTERYHELDPTPTYLRQRIGLERSTFREQWPGLTTAHQNRYYEKFMRSEGWDKYLEIYFWNRRKLTAWVCVRRLPDQPDFTARELRLFADLRFVLAPCMERLHALLRERMATRSLLYVFQRNLVPLVILDWRLRPIYFNHEARKLCLAWSHGQEYARMIKLPAVPKIPAEILHACKKCRDRWHGRIARDQKDPLSGLVAHPEQAELSAFIDMVSSEARNCGWPYFVVRFNRVQTTASVGVLDRLSPCERDVALRVQDGLSNEQIARELGKSEATVKMQLHSIFRKLGVGNRTRLAALMR